MGVQDKSQIKEAYGEKLAEVMENAAGNFICGQVNGRTAEDVSKIFGSLKKVNKSMTQGDDSRSLNISFENEELLPRSVIETFSQGMFCGKVADDFRSPIKRKHFCGMVQRDPKAVAEKEARYVNIPVMTDFGEDEVNREVDDQGMTILADEIKDRLRHESSVIPTEDELAVRTQESMAAMSPQTINERMKKLYEDMIKARAQRQVLMNFIQVKKDIKNLIESEFSESSDTPDYHDHPELNPEVVDAFHDF